MARPLKKGLDYFPFDVNFLNDKKIRTVKGRYGTDGIMLYIYLLCNIYQEGYFIISDDDLKYIIADELKMSDEKVEQIINFLLGRSLFNDKLFKSDKVLTARSIQLRYQEAKKGLKRDIEVDKKFWLLNESETQDFIKFSILSDKSEINSSKSKINPSKSEINSQSKVKESKGNKSKVNNTKDEYGSIIADFTSDSELTETVYEFIKMRKLIKKPMTDRALTMMLSKLKDMGDVKTQIAILNQSIENCWKGIFPLKNDTEQHTPTRKSKENDWPF